MRDYLDPDQTENHYVPLVLLELPAELPPHIRNFGYYPALRYFFPGDLLLFSPKKPSLASRQIIKDQKKGFDDGHARWTHAAIYVFEGMIVETTTRQGTALDFLHDYVPTHDILVRRNTTIEQVQRTNIVFHAFTKIQMAYPMLSMAVYIWQLQTLKNRLFNPQYYNICSELFCKSWLSATMVGLQGCPADGLTKPAHLSATRTLTDIDVPWMKLSE